MEKKVRLTEEEVAKANSVDIISLAEKLDYTLRKQGHTFKIIGSGLGGVFITEDGSRWFSHANQKGGGPIQFLMEMEGYTWREAANYLLDENSLFHPQQRKSDNVRSKPKSELVVVLPKLKQTQSNHRKWNDLYGYLTEQRGLSPSIVNEMMKNGKLYFSEPFLAEKKDRCNYIVFVGHDKVGEIKYAAKKSPYKDKGYSGELKNSQKEYSFSIEGQGNTLYVFEAPIDLLSYMTLKEINRESCSEHCLSLGGLTDKALIKYLADHKEVDHVVLCLDNDLDGKKAAFDKESGKMVTVAWNHGQKAEERIGKELKDAGYKVGKIIPPGGVKDWNELLTNYRKTARGNEQKKEPEAEIIEVTEVEAEER